MPSTATANDTPITLKFHVYVEGCGLIRFNKEMNFDGYTEDPAQAYDFGDFDEAFELASGIAAVLKCDTHIRVFGDFGKHRVSDAELFGHDGSHVH